MFNVELGFKFVEIARSMSRVIRKNVSVHQDSIKQILFERALLSDVDRREVLLILLLSFFRQIVQSPYTTLIYPQVAREKNCFVAFKIGHNCANNTWPDTRVCNCARNLFGNTTFVALTQEIAPFPDSIIDLRCTRELYAFLLMACSYGVFAMLQQNFVIAERPLTTRKAPIWCPFPTANSARVQIDFDRSRVQIRKQTRRLRPYPNGAVVSATAIVFFNVADMITTKPKSFHCDNALWTQTASSRRATPKKAAVSGGMIGLERTVISNIVVLAGC
jgi:hypothetical protein